MKFKDRRMLVAMGLASLVRVSAAHVCSALWFLASLLFVCGAETSSVGYLLAAMVNLVVATLIVREVWKDVKI